MDAREHLSLLIHMSTIKLSESIKRRNFLHDLGLSKGLQKSLIDYLIEYPDPLSEASYFSEYDRFEYLYTAIQFMKCCRRVRYKEIRFCQRLAARMGYSPQVVYELSTFIYSDPMLSINKKFLRKINHLYSKQRAFMKATGSLRFF